jgi:hypothetical protein
VCPFCQRLGSEERTDDNYRCTTVKPSEGILALEERGDLRYGARGQIDPDRGEFGDRFAAAKSEPSSCLSLPSTMGTVDFPDIL